MTDELEQRLRAADPVPASVPVDTVRTPRARNLLERTMTDAPITLDPPRSSPPRRWALVAAAAVAVAVIGTTVVVQAGGDDEPTTLALSAAADDAMGMCIQVTPETLADGAPVAFEGTVTSVEGQTATLSVDRWFSGGDADEVTVTGPSENETALLGGVPLEQDGHYLISAIDGVVRSCGMSGEVSPELQTLFEDAFGG